MIKFFNGSINTIYYHIKSRYLGNCIVLYRNNDNEDVLVVGPQWLGLLVTLFVIFFAVYLFYNSINQSYNSLSKSFYWFIVIIESVFVFTTTIFLLLTALLDPGVIKSSDYYEDYDIKGHWCDICLIHIPEYLKVRHCNECNVCIEGLDHHCPWIGKCIGKRTMKWFIMFNISWVIGVLNLIFVAFFI